MGKYILIWTVYIVFISVIFVHCTNNRGDIKVFMNSSDKDSLIRGISLIQKNDTQYIKFIVETLGEDVRISHKRDFYGHNVYSSKILALERVSGLKPPNPKLAEVDSINIIFYREWARSERYIK